MEFFLVCATRLSQAEFLEKSPLGRSLKINSSSNVKLRLFEKNTEGLPAIYNQAIKELPSSGVVIFIHDDLALLDFFWQQRVGRLLQEYAVLGLAGACSRVPFQSSWAFRDANFKWDDSFPLSGVVGHGIDFPCQNISRYGPTPKEVKLLDGCFLAAKLETIREHQLQFDEQFQFHFYDMDFCRALEGKNLKMSTVDISATHKSGGHFGSVEWQKAYYDI